MTRALPVLLLALAACGPSINAAAKADIDARAAKLSARPDRFDAPAAAVPMPFAVGQWVQYKFVDDKGQPSFMTMKLVGQEGAAFWYEAVNESYYGKSVVKMLVDFGDRRNPETITIKEAKLRNPDGQIVEYPPALIGMMNSTLRGNLGPIVVAWEGMPQEDASVPAGRFARCYKVQSSASWGPFRSTSIAWSHPAVPLSGMVRSQGVDTPTVGELVGFGTTGAASEL